MLKMYYPEKMKFNSKYFTVAVFSIAFLSLASRGEGQTLSFSQALYLSTVDTVPVGKVWKVERIVNTASFGRYVYINNETIGHMSDRSYGISVNSSSTGAATFNGPIWLPAGSIVGNAASPEVRFSILEFTVVP